MVETSFQVVHLFLSLSRTETEETDVKNPFSYRIGIKDKNHDDHVFYSSGSGSATVVTPLSGYSSASALTVSH